MVPLLVHARDVHPDEVMRFGASLGRLWLSVLGSVAGCGFFSHARAGQATTINTGVVEITPIEKRSCGENPNNPHINVKLRLRRIVLLVHPLPNSR